mmetsp:Transcript_66691/g.106000  ORF Transcript_66691/g.106000 Transcript_66691/m.106000 type:complete len:452 (+) Transcript_66691:1-1356(+)
MDFMLTFSIFTTLWCSLSCYIYNRPYDSPQGTSLVSCIRRTPFLSWFFRQPQRQQTTAEEEELVDDSETHSLKQNHVAIDTAPGDTATDTDECTERTTGSSSSLKLSPPAAAPSSPPSRKLLFGDENTTLIVCCIGLLIAYLTWGFMQERIMGHPYGDADDEANWFKYSSFCVFINRMFGLLVSSVVLQFTTPSGNKAPPYVISLCALSNMSSSWLQYEALHYVTFPVQTIFKSSKILITMAVGKFVLKQSFPLKKYLNALVVAVGVYIFLSAHKQSKEDKAEQSGQGEEDDADDLGIYFYLGLALTAGYAFCDAFTSNWQSRVFKATGIGPMEMMQGVNAFTFIVSFMFCLGDLYDIYAFYVNHSLIVVHSLLMGLCAGLGQVLIFYTIKTFGPVKFAAVMTTRMMCSVIISILYYGHSMNALGVIGMCITFAALYYQAFSKSGKKKTSK